RRQFLHLALGGAALPAMARIAGAQAHPARPVRLIVGARADGGFDIARRLMAQWLSMRLGAPFVIENPLDLAKNVGKLKENNDTLLNLRWRGRYRGNIRGNKSQISRPSLGDDVPIAFALNFGVCAAACPSHDREMRQRPKTRADAGSSG